MTTKQPFIAAIGKSHFKFSEKLRNSFINGFPSPHRGGVLLSIKRRPDDDEDDEDEEDF
jgi:hypothetical protein